MEEIKVTDYRATSLRRIHHLPGIIDQRRLLFWRSWRVSENSVLRILLYLNRNNEEVRYAVHV